VSSQVKAPPAPLTERDAQQLIRALGSGDQPKVLVRSDEDGVPSPTRGRLVGYLDGDDTPFQVVLTQDGRERELSVPAAALAVLPRTSAEIIARTASGADEPAATAPAEAPAADQTEEGTPQQGTPQQGTPQEDEAPEDKAVADMPAESKVDAAPAPAKKAAPRKAARAGGGNGSGEVTVTVTVTGEATTVEAASGSKKLAKAVTLPVAAGRAMAQALGVEAVTDAVEMLVEEYRLAKEREAEQLRSRLAALEKELAEYAEGTGEPESTSHS
jgi:hypothetical protein